MSDEETRKDGMTLFTRLECGAGVRARAQANAKWHIEIGINTVFGPMFYYEYKFMSSQAYSVAFDIENWMTEQMFLGPVDANNIEFSCHKPTDGGAN